MHRAYRTRTTLKVYTPSWRKYRCSTINVGWHVFRVTGSLNPSRASKKGFPVAKALTRRSQEFCYFFAACFVAIDHGIDHRSRTFSISPDQFVPLGSIELLKQPPTEGKMMNVYCRMHQIGALELPRKVDPSTRVTMGVGIFR